MVIAINTKITSIHGGEDRRHFIFEILSRIIQSHPEHTFVFIGETAPDQLLAASGNVKVATLGPRRQNPALRYLWLNVRLPSLLKKLKADGLISFGVGPHVISLAQLVLVDNLDYLFQPFLFTRTELLFFRTFVPRLLRKARAIVTVSAFGKSAISKQFKIDSDKIKVVHKGIDKNFIPVPSSQRENIKMKYARGNEYFIYAGDIALHKNLLNLLKAFSAFKKRQKSNMHLLIIGKPGSKFDLFMENLRLFKFKEDVSVLECVAAEETPALIAAAYAMVYPSHFDFFATQPLHAIQSGVPVIVSSRGAMPELLQEAALYVDADNFKEIAVKMMLLFKDEVLRNALIEKGKIQAMAYHWDVAAGLFWETFQAALPG